MQVLLILAHPDSSSLNHAIATEIQKTLQNSGHTVFYHDLYKENFDPILQSHEIPRGAELDPVISLHCKQLTEADGIIIVHPNWWGQPPAILTGWIDRVIRPEVAYRFIGDDKGEGVPEGLLKTEAALIINTSNTNEDREREVFGDPLERIWKDCVFGLCGVTNIHRITLRIVITSTPQQRTEWIQMIQGKVLELFPCENE